jgi:hypothetical protein
VLFPVSRQHHLQNEEFESCRNGDLSIVSSESDTFSISSVHLCRYILSFFIWFNHKLTALRMVGKSYWNICQISKQINKNWVQTEEIIFILSIFDILWKIFFKNSKRWKYLKWQLGFVRFFTIRNVMADLFTVQFFSSPIRVIFT